MAPFSVIPGVDGSAAFLVAGPDGTPTAALTDFLVHLTRSSASAYTLRAYAIGLAHFCTWLHDADTPLDAVTPSTIGAYIDDFRTQPKGGACRPDPQRAGQINPRTRKPAPALQRQPRTINHRLSVLASFFTYHIQQDAQSAAPRWQDRPNPVPAAADAMRGHHGMRGRDAPKRGPAGAFRRRVPRDLPKHLDPLLIEQLITTARSWRDKAILTLLYRTGQRIGDWSPVAGRHGVLGMTLADIDERARTITVRLKGARDEHIVPITDDFWPLFHQYLTHERPTDPALQAAWVGLRKGQGKPLSYAAFESSLRSIGRKLDLNVNAHMLRHTLAQALVDTGNLKVAQEILGHRHIATTADTYARADEQAMLAAITMAQRHCDVAAQDSRAASQSASSLAPAQPTLPTPARTFVFPYDATTLAELDAAAAHQPHPPA